MSALGEVVDKHRARLVSELSATVRSATWTGTDKTEFVGKVLSALVARVHKSEDRGLVELLEQCEKRGAKPAELVGLLSRVASAVRGLLFVDVPSRRMAAVASGGIDRAVAESLESVGRDWGRPGAGATDAPKESTIIRNINEILSAQAGEVSRGIVLAVDLRRELRDHPSLADLASASERVGIAKEAFANASAKLMTIGDGLLLGAIVGGVGGGEFEESLRVALRLVRDNRLSPLAVGIASGSIAVEPSGDGFRLSGPTTTRALGLAAGAGDDQVNVDDQLFAATSAAYVLRPTQLSLGRVFRLDTRQPQWLDRWEQAAFVSDPDLVGRGAAQRRLRSILRAPERKRIVVALKGKAGVGKNTLIRATLDEMGVPKHRVLYGQPHTMAHTPYWPLIAIARQILELQDGALPGKVLRERVDTLSSSTALVAGLRRVLPTLGALLGVEDADESAIEHLEPGVMRSEIAASLRLLLEAAADREPDQPLVVVLREAQDLDAPTVHALGHALDTYNGVAQLVVVLCHRGPLRTTPAFARAGMTALTLEALDGAETLALARGMLDQEELPHGVETMLLERCGGSPMMAAFLVRYLVEGGWLSRRGGTWVAESLPALDEIPTRLADLVAKRIHQLPEQLASMLEVAATLGQSLPWEALELLWVSRDIPHDDLRRSANLLCEIGLLVRGRNRGLRFAHPLLREVAYRKQDVEERKKTHRLVAQTYRERYPDAIRQLPALLFHHCWSAGDQAAARTAAVQAARRAMLLHDHKRGLAIIEAALSLPDDGSDTAATERFELLSARERINDARAERQEQARDLAELERLAEFLSDAVRRGIILHRLSRLRLLTGDIDGAIELGEESIAMLRSGDRLDLSNALRSMALVRWSAKDQNGAVAALREALSIYEELSHKRGMGFVLHNLGLFALDTGALDQARDHFERSLALKRETDDRDGVAVVLDSLGQVSLLEGDRKGAAACFEQAAGERLTAGDLAGAAASQVNLGEAVLRDEPARAEELARNALKHTGSKRLVRSHIEGNILLARALVAQGKKNLGGRPAALAIKRAKEIGSGLLTLRAQLAQAEVDLAHGQTNRTERAVLQAENAAQLALKLGAVRWRVEALVILAEAAAQLDKTQARRAAQEALTMLEQKTPPGADATNLSGRCRKVLEVAASS